MTIFFTDYSKIIVKNYKLIHLGRKKNNHTDSPGNLPNSGNQV